MLVDFFNEFLSLPVSTLQKSLAKYKKSLSKIKSNLIHLGKFYVLPYICILMVATLTAQCYYQ